MNTNGIHIKLPDSPIGKQIQQKLTDEQTLHAFDKILNRIDTLEKAVLNLTQIIEQGPGLVSMGMDMVDEGIQKAAKNGVYVEERIGAALELAEKLTAPAMMEKLNGLFEMANQAPGLVAMGLDMMDEGIQKAAKNGVYVEERIGAALELAEKLTAPAMMEKLNGLFEMANQVPGLMAMTMDMFDEEYRRANSNMNLPALTAFLGTTGKALSEAIEAPEKKIGAFGLFRALNNPERQKAMGFLMAFLERLGKHL